MKKKAAAKKPVRREPRITLAMLERKGACSDAQYRFKRLFGRSVVVNKRNALRWIEDGGSVYALADYLPLRLQRTYEQRLNDHPWSQGWRYEAVSMFVQMFRAAKRTRKTA